MNASGRMDRLDVRVDKGQAMATGRARRRRSRGIVSDVEEQSLRADPARRVYFSTFQLRNMPGRFSLELLLDAPSIVTALVVLGASAALAGYLPARRAARVGPLVALRGL